MTAAEKTLESKLRRALYKDGFALIKSRKRNITIHDYGGYMIVNGWDNTIVCGERFNLTLADVRSFVDGTA